VTDRTQVAAMPAIPTADQAPRQVTQAAISGLVADRLPASLDIEMIPLILAQPDTIQVLTSVLPPEQPLPVPEMERLFQPVGMVVTVIASLSISERVCLPFMAI